MPTVETTITLTIPRAGMSLQELERRVWEQLCEAAGSLLRDACREMESQILLHGAGQLRRDKPRQLDLLTRFGWLRLERWQLQDRRTGRYSRPLDQVLGIKPRRHASPWVIEQAVGLATRLPYRQATDLLCRLLGQPGTVDHRTLYGWVQAEGQTCIEAEDRRQEAVFGDGVVPPRDETVREIVVAEADGTFLRAQREPGPDFEVRLGVLYSGRQLTSTTARHKRYRLQERVLYAGVESADDFKERFFLAGEERLSLSLARHLLVVGDGADWIEALAGHDRWRATYQLDHWHILHQARLTFSDRPNLVAEIARALRAGEDQRILHLVRLARLTAADPERVAAYEAYLRANQHGICGARRLARQLSREARVVLVEGSGAVEKQSDLLVGRRFEGQGMRWTRRGAHRLIKLRVRELERAA